MPIVQELLRNSPATAEVAAYPAASTPIRILQRESLPLLTILLAIVVTVGPPLWDGRLFSGIDTYTLFIPLYDVLGERLRQGDIPGWNPHIFGGVSFVGDPQSGWMYLPAMVFFTIFPAGTAIKAFVLFHFACAGASAYALGRVLGMPRLAATVAGTAYVFSPLVTFVECCAIRIQLAVWLPLAILGIEMAFRAGDVPGRVAWCSLSGFALSQIMAGWFGQGTYYAGLVVGSYVLFRAATQRPPQMGGLLHRLLVCLTIGLAIFVIAVGLAAAGLLPRLDSLDQTNLAGGVYGDAQSTNQTELDPDPGGWRWERLTAYLLDNRALSRWYYAGAGTLVLALVAPVLARLRFGTPYFVTYSVVVAVLALEDGRLHRVFYLLPKFQTLHEHAPNRVLALLPFGLAMLAGATVASLQRRLSPPWLVALAAGVPFLLLGTLAPIARAENRPVSPETWVSATTVGLTLVVFAALVGLGRRRPVPHSITQLVLAIPVLVIVLDPVGFVRLGMLPHRPTTPTQARQLVDTYTAAEGSSGAADFLRARLSDGEPFRYIGYDLRPLLRDHRDRYVTSYMRPSLWAILEGNLALPHGLDDAQGYNAVQYTRFIDYVLVMNAAPQEYHETNIQLAGLSSPLLDVLNVRYVVTPAELPLDHFSLAPIATTWPIVYEDASSRIFENPTVLPRVWIVHEARVLPREQGLNLLQYNHADPRRIAFLEREPPPLAPATDLSADWTYTILHEDDRILVETLTDAPGLLMFSEAYDPAWRAYVDGERVDLYAADGLFRAVPIPAGLHYVDLRYEPISLRIGLGVSAMTASAVAVVVTFVVTNWLQSLRHRQPV